MPPAAMQNQFPDREVLSQPLLTETTNHITGSLTAEPNCGHWRAVKQNQFLDREQLSQRVAIHGVDQSSCLIVRPSLTGMWIVDRSQSLFYFVPQ